ncbi:MAG TPA: thymidine phosphorylase [Blastocatellia bacterium]|nr:thymidine phosphorylase [Blastocatellia bacterium]
MLASSVIEKKRRGGALSRREISFVIQGYSRGDVPDYQMSALAMAICFKGMSAEETLWLTEEMIASGKTLDLSDFDQRAVDKHSTGGVGDKTSLVVAPVVAACGVLTPMISGRALGHSGGTLDKLESISGFRTDLSVAELRKALQKVGAALIGQTEEIAPADKKLYALRDVTATVDCIPLMTASILSKKIAEGIDGLVLDVKAGNGAFMKTQQDAADLARLMVEIATGMKKECVALITGMDQPLGREVGNSREIVEALEALKGRGPNDLIALCRELVAEMLVLGRAADDLESGRLMYDRAIGSGQALEKMRQIIVEQGGDARVIEDYRRLPGAAAERVVKAGADGWVQSVDTAALGRASMLLGAGRARVGDRIDHGVGLTVEAKPGDRVEPSSALAVLHFNEAAYADEAESQVAEAYLVGEAPVAQPALIMERLG